MSIYIEVVRAPADKQGPDISDSLITSEPIAIERGTHEINKSSTNRMNISGTGPAHSFIMPGAIVELIDLEQGKKRGFVKGFSRTTQRNGSVFTADANYQIETEA